MKVSLVYKKIPQIERKLHDMQNTRRIKLMLPASPKYMTLYPHTLYI